MTRWIRDLGLSETQLSVCSKESVNLPTARIYHECPSKLTTFEFTSRCQGSREFCTIPRWVLKSYFAGGYLVAIGFTRGCLIEEGLMNGYNIRRYPIGDFHIEYYRLGDYPI